MTSGAQFKAVNFRVVWVGGGYFSACGLPLEADLVLIFTKKFS
jgi:hypothetical protein